MQKESSSESGSPPISPSAVTNTSMVPEAAAAASSSRKESPRASSLAGSGAQQEPADSSSSSSSKPSSLAGSLSTSTAFPTDLSAWASNAGRILAGIARGLIESTNFQGFLSYMVRSAKIRRLFTECLMLNLALLVGVVLVRTLLQSVEFNLLLTGLLDAFFSIAWVLPMSIVTQVLGVTMFFEMYVAAAEQKRVDTNGKSRPHRNLNFNSLSEMLMKTVVTLVFGLIGTAISFIPWGIGTAASMVLGAFLHAFYCFDYRFLDQGFIDKRTGKFTPLKLSAVTRCFDLCWSYYLGFGMSHMLIRLGLEVGLGIGLFGKLAICTVLFPINVIMTVDAIPGPETPQVKVPVFTKLYHKTSQWLTRWEQNRNSKKAVKKSTVDEGVVVS